MSTRPLTVEAHLGLVVLLAVQMAGREPLLDDLVQAGCEGLLEALRRFDPARGTSFSTYAAPWIKQQIRRALWQEQPPPLPAEPPISLQDAQERQALQQALLQVVPTLSLKERRVLELRFGLGEEPCHTLAETGQRLGVTTSRARQIEQQALRQLRAVLEPTG
jgi:RNA polymerase sigma factor (sigma-70 family)